MRNTEGRKPLGLRGQERPQARHKQAGLSGQASIIIVLAIVIFFVIVIIFTWQRFLLENPEPGSIGELKKLLRVKVEERIYTGVFETMETIGRQGGYLDMPSPNIEFGNDLVPYWQICQHGFIPSPESITQSIREGIKRYLNAWDMPEFEGKRVFKSDINASDVEVVLAPKHIVVRVWMHITIDGYKLDLPFEVGMDSSFLSMYNFARDFTSENLDARHFETFIGSIIFHSYENVEDTANPMFLPNQGVLSECGQVIYKTWDDVKFVIEKMISYALGHMVFWQPAPGGEREFMKYYIPDLNGSTYPEYKIDFFPVGELTQSSLQPSQNPINIVNNKILHKYAPVCRKEYDVRYSWHQPVVMKFTDAVNYSFQFGFLPYIHESAIGSCSADVKWNEIVNYCDIKSCYSKIRVLDTDGNPIEGVSVTFGACQIGKATDSQGIAEGGIPCGIAELNTYHRNYIYHYDIVSSQEIKDKTIVLEKMPLLITTFYRYMVSYEKSGNFYADPFEGYMPDFQGYDCLKDMLYCNYNLTRENVKDYYLVINFRRRDPLPWELEEITVGNMNERNTSVTVKNIDYIAPGWYIVDSMLIDPVKGGITGVLATDYELKERPTTRDIYVNVPSYKFLPAFSFDTGGYEYYRDRLLEMMTECGIEHITDESPPRECHLYTWCGRDERGAPRSCTQQNRDLVLNTLLAECNQVTGGTMQEKIDKLEYSCGIRVRFMD